MNLKKVDYKQLKNFSKHYRTKLLKISQSVPALHVGGSFSCFDILNIIFNVFYKSNKTNFLLSKGHTAIAQYIVLNHKKIIKDKELDLYCKKSGKLGVHPEITTNGILASTGSLGHGLSIAGGISLRENNKLTFVVMSDGELMEGSVWEAVLMISSLKINNIVVIVDYNGLQSSTFSNDTHKTLFPIDKKFKAFGWDSIRCDGHNLKNIYTSIKKKKKNRPLAIIAKTIKGYPVSFMMNKPIWHYRSPNENELKIAVKEINEK